MARITGSYLEDEIEAAKVTVNHNIAELLKAEEVVVNLKETIAATKGAINAFEYLKEGKLEEEETPKPDDPLAGQEGGSVG